jgi:hypothetical protein
MEIEDPETIVRNIGYYVQIKQDKKGLDSLSLAERVFFVVYNFDCELCNGGADQYLVNSSGDNANEVTSALSTIGAMKSALLAKRLESFFPDQQIPCDRGERLSLLRTYWNNPLFHELTEDVDTKYYQDEDGIFTLLYKYFENNQHEFAPVDFDVPLSLFDYED